MFLLWIYPNYKEEVLFSVQLVIAMQMLLVRIQWNTKRVGHSDYRTVFCFRFLESRWNGVWSVGKYCQTKK